MTAAYNSSDRKLKLEMKETAKNNFSKAIFECPPSFEKTHISECSSVVASDINDVDSEIWLIQTPANFSLTCLNGKKISLTKPSTIEDEKSNYTVTASKNKDIQRISVLYPNQENGNFRTADQEIKGQLTFIESIPPIQEFVPEIESKPKVAFPTGLKQRFSPFGSNLPVTTISKKIGKKKLSKDQLDLPETNISKKVGKKKLSKDQLDSSLVKKKKKKDKQKKKKLKGVSEKSKTISKPKHKRKH